MHSSYVVTDPKGTVLVECGKLLQRRGGYKIKVLNTINFKKSMRYNPFAYLRSDCCAPFFLYCSKHLYHFSNRLKTL